MLTADSSRTSEGPRPAPASTAAASARSRNACSSAAPAYRDANTPSAGSRPASSPAPAAGTSTASAAEPASGPASHSVTAPGTTSASGPAPVSGPACGPVNRGPACAQPGRADPSPCPREPRPRLTVVCATPSRRPISASLAPPRPQFPGLLPLLPGHLPRRAAPVLLDQRGRPVPQRRVMQRRDVVLRQSQQLSDRPAPEPQLPQHRQRQVPRYDVPGRVLEQHPGSGHDHAPAAVGVQVKITRPRHALKDRGNGW
jgi:hypothetical protein